MRRSVLFLVVTAGLLGCASRFVLSDKELSNARADGGVDHLLPLVSNRTVAVYEQPISDRTRVGRRLEHRTHKRRHKDITGRSTGGKIIEEDLQNGQRRLWVSYDRSCVTRECALSFVQTEDGRYRLLSAPSYEGHTKRVYRSFVTKRRRMEQGKLASLSDANAVYLLKRRRGRHRTVFLELKKTDSKQVDKTKKKNGGW